MSRLQQVLWNLLKNSIKFTLDGGCIGLHCYKKDGNAVIEVSDSGIGIDPDAMKRIFNAFEQAEHGVTRQFGGLGLGLAITKRLVELHGGSITAYSPGKDLGATFRVNLPLCRFVEEPQSEKKVAKQPSAKSRKVLLVEDNADTALMMSELLRSYGYQVEMAGDVTEALAAIAGGPYDLVISDIGLPGRSGLDLLKELRSQGNQLKAIAVSGYGREEDVERTRQAGFVEHLTKPVNFDTLHETIEHVLNL